MPVIGFEQTQYSVVEGDTTPTEICVALMPPTTLDRTVTVLLITTDGTAEGKIYYYIKLYVIYALPNLLTTYPIHYSKYLPLNRGGASEVSGATLTDGVAGARDRYIMYVYMYMCIKSLG